MSTSTTPQPPAIRALAACVELLRNNPPHRGAFDLNGAEYDNVLACAEEALAAVGVVLPIGGEA